MTPGPPRRPFLWAMAAWPLCALAFHWQAARPGMALSGYDLRYFFYAAREAAAAALRRGDLGGWERGLFLGYPLLGDPQAALLLPTTWLTLPWDAPRALTLSSLLHLIIAGWGMIWWMRRRGLGAAEGLLAAVLFALGAKETVHLQHWVFAASTAWWPWMLGGLEAFRHAEGERGRGRHLLLTAAAAALSWLGGGAQLAYLGTLVAGAYALAMAPELWRRRPADAALALVAAPLGLLLAAPAVLPIAELAALGPRGAGVDYRFATSWKWPDRWGLALFLVPRAYGGSWLLPEMNLWEATGYLGILPLGLLLAAPLRRCGTWVFAALGLLGVWLCFGEDAWLGLHRLLFRFLPGFGAFRNPTRTLFVTSLCSALLAAEALALLRRPGGRRPALRAAGGLAAVGALAPLLPRLHSFPFDREAGVAGAFTASMLALGGVGWLMVRRRALARPALAAAWALFPAALCASDLYRAFGGWNDVAPAAGEVAALGDLAPLVPAAPAPRRVAVVCRWGRTANAPWRQGWEGVTGYGPVSIARVRALLEATRDDRVRPPGPAVGDVNFPRPRPESRLWPLLATPLVVSDEPRDLPRLAELRPEWGLPTFAYAAPALPRVFWTGAWEVRGDADLEEPMLRAARGEVAVLAGPLPGLPPAGPAPASAAVAAVEIRVLPSALEATVDAPADGVAVILDPWFPGWTATVDGARAPLVRADFAFQAVPVKAGRHQLRLAYGNDRLLPGLAVAAAALLALLGALAWRRRGGAGRASREG